MKTLLARKCAWKDCRQPAISSLRDLLADGSIGTRVYLCEEHLWLGWAELDKRIVHLEECLRRIRSVREE
jgi:hypothetical protein